MPLWVVDIDLSRADHTAFDGYEAQVLALLPRFGGRMERRLRTDDSSREFHILHFADDAGFAAFLASPQRADLHAAGPETGTTATIHRVSEI